MKLGAVGSTRRVQRPGINSSSPAWCLGQYWQSIDPSWMSLVVGGSWSNKRWTQTAVSSQRPHRQHGRMCSSSQVTKPNNKTIQQRKANNSPWKLLKNQQKQKHADCKDRLTFKSLGLRSTRFHSLRRCSRERGSGFESHLSAVQRHQIVLGLLLCVRGGGAV